MGNLLSGSSDATKTGTDIDSTRERARVEGDLMGKCFADSQAAYKRGDGAAAKELSEKGKAHQAAMHRLNKEAAEAIFSEKNKGRDLGTIDLHGLFVKEAIDKTEKRIELLQSKHKSVKTLVIITGAGNHSEGGIPKLKPAIEAIMSKYKVAVTPDKPNHGCLCVDLYPTAPGWLGSSWQSCIVM